MNASYDIYIFVPRSLRSTRRDVGMGVCYIMRGAQGKMRAFLHRTVFSHSYYCTVILALSVKCGALRKLPPLLLPIVQRLLFDQSLITLCHPHKKYALERFIGTRSFWEIDVIDARHMVLSATYFFHISKIITCPLICFRYISCFDQLFENSFWFFWRLSGKTSRREAYIGEECGMTFF